MKKNYPPPSLHWLSIVYITAFLFFPTLSFSQNTCNTAILQTMNVHDEYQFQSSQNDYWLKFTASSAEMDIILQQANSNPQASIVEIKLYSNSCASLQLEASLTINSADSILHSNNLIISNDYFINISQSNGNPEYFGIYLSQQCGTNLGLSCPLPDCDLIQNGDFNTLGNCLKNIYLATNWNFALYQNINTSAFYYNTFKDPLPVNINTVTAYYDHVCGWGKTYSTPAIHYENQNNYFLRASGYGGSNGYSEMFYTKLNNGNSIPAGKYHLIFDTRVEDPNNLTSFDIFLTNQITAPTGTPISSAHYSYANWTTVDLEVNYTAAMAANGLQYLHFKPIGNNSNSTVVNLDNVHFILFGLTLNTPNPICEGDLVDITADYCTSAEPYTTSFQWTSSPNDPTMIVNQGHLTANPTITSPITYTCVMTTSAGVIATESKTVTVNPLPSKPDISSSSNHICNGNPMITINNYNSSGSVTYNYKIDVPFLGGGTNLGTWSSVNAQSFNSNVSSIALNGGAYWDLIVEATNNYGCSTYDTVKIFDCCQGGGSQNDFVDFELTGNMNFSGSDIFISGHFKITPGSILDLSGLTVHMGGDAKIIIEEDGVLNSIDVTYESCDHMNMWDGIYINNNNGIFGNFNSTDDHFMEAKNAIVSLNGGIYTINKGNFLKNYISLLVKGYVGDHQGTIISSKFTGNVLGLFPYINVNSYCDIQLFDLIKTNNNIPIGDDSDPAFINTFLGSDYAIKTYESDFTLRNANMDNHKIAIDIEGDDVVNDVIIGGVNANQGVSISGTSLSQYGIKAIGSMNIDLRGNKIRDILRGLDIFDNKNTNINIIENTIDIPINGIAILITDIASDLFIQQNDLTTYSSSSNITSDGIIVASNSFISNNNITERTSICENSITRFIKGITTVQTTETKIIGNFVSIDLLSAAYSIGVDLKSLSNPIVFSNSIMTTNYSPISSHYASIIGIRSNLVSGGNIQGNHINEYASGMYFDGENMPTTIGLNTMTGNYYGIYLDGYDNASPPNLIGAEIGQQGQASMPWDNQWINNIGDRIYGKLQNYTEWYYDLNGNFNIQPYTVNPTNFFIPIQTPSSGYSYSANCPKTPIAPLAPNPNSTQISNAATQRYNEVGKLIAMLMPYNAAYLKSNAPAFNIYSSNASYYYALHAFERLSQKPAYLSLGTADDVIYKSFYNYLKTQNPSLLYQLKEAAYAGDTLKVAQLLNSFNPQNLQEINASQVFSIYNRSWAQHIYSFSPQDTAALLSIALMNPNGGGHAVYTARIMLGLDFVAANSNNTIIRKGKTTIKQDKEKESDLLVYPNPVKENLTIELSNKEISISRIIISNILGQKVYEKDSPSGNKLTINTSAFDKGIYLIEVFSNTQRYKTKLIVE